MDYRTLLVLPIFFFVIVSCGSGSEESSPAQDDEAVAIELATSTPTEAAAVVEPPTATPTPTATVEVVEPPTVTPTVEPEPTEAEVPDTPTPSPAADTGQSEPEEPSPTPEPVEEPTSTPTPTPPPAPQITGTGGFGNNLATADKFYSTSWVFLPHRTVRHIKAGLSLMTVRRPVSACSMSVLMVGSPSNGVHPTARIS